MQASWNVRQNHFLLSILDCLLVASPWLKSTWKPILDKIKSRVAARKRRYMSWEGRMTLKCIGEGINKYCKAKKYVEKSRSHPSKFMFHIAVSTTTLLHDVGTLSPAPPKISSQPLPEAASEDQKKKFSLFWLESFLVIPLNFVLFWQVSSITYLRTSTRPHKSKGLILLDDVINH